MLTYIDRFYNYLNRLFKFQVKGPTLILDIHLQRSWLIVWQQILMISSANVGRPPGKKHMLHVQYMQRFCVLACSLTVCPCILQIYGNWFYQTMWCLLGCIYLEIQKAPVKMTCNKCSALFICCLFRINLFRKKKIRGKEREKKNFNGVLMLMWVS